MSSEESVTTDSSYRIRQFGLYRSIDARTEEFLKLSRKKQIRQGCACAAVSTVITITVVVSFLLIYEYGINSTWNSKKIKSNWYGIMNDSTSPTRFEENLGKESLNLDHATLKLLPIILKALKKKSHSSNTYEYTKPGFQYEEKATTDFTFQRNIFATRDWMKIPTSRFPVSDEINKTRKIDYFSKIRKIRDYQRILNYVDKMISEKVGLGYSNPMKSKYMFIDKMVTTTQKNNKKHEKRRLSNVNFNKKKQNFEKTQQFVSKKIQRKMVQKQNETLQTSISNTLNCTCQNTYTTFFKKILNCLQNVLGDTVDIPCYKLYENIQPRTFPPVAVVPTTIINSTTAEMLSTKPIVSNPSILKSTKTTPHFITIKKPTAYLPPVTAVTKKPLLSFKYEGILKKEEKKKKKILDQHFLKKHLYNNVIHDTARKIVKDNEKDTENNRIFTDILHALKYGPPKAYDKLNTRLTEILNPMQKSLNQKTIPKFDHPLEKIRLSSYRTKPIRPIVKKSTRPIFSEEIYYDDDILPTTTRHQNQIRKTKYSFEKKINDKLVKYNILPTEKIKQMSKNIKNKVSIQSLKTPSQTRKSAIEIKTSTEKSNDVFTRSITSTQVLTHSSKRNVISVEPRKINKSTDMNIALFPVTMTTEQKFTTKATSMDPAFEKITQEDDFYDDTELPVSNRNTTFGSIALYNSKYSTEKIIPPQSMIPKHRPSYLEIKRTNWKQEELQEPKEPQYDTTILNYFDLL